MTQQRGWAEPVASWTSVTDDALPALIVNPTESTVEPPVVINSADDDADSPYHTDPYKGSLINGFDD